MATHSRASLSCFAQEDVAIGRPNLIIKVGTPPLLLAAAKPDCWVEKLGEGLGGVALLEKVCH